MPKPKSTTSFRAQTQAHTHWINDIALAQNHGALVSASSDLTVRVWRPHTDHSQEPTTIGQHADYVKCLATPDQNTDWVVSGGLDRKIYMWDLNGGGKTLEIDVSGEEITEKGSVYALSVNNHILASGGPESIVRLWDPRTGKRITKFVGHTDNVRAILVNAAGDTVVTASSDQTVKVWSVTAGRCTHTLTMHNDSVWSLFSDVPDLGVFYSSDRSGLVVKTDVRGTMGDLDYGLSVAVAQENDGVSKLVAAGDYIWTATSSSSINRWTDVDTEVASDALSPPPSAHHRASLSSVKSREPSITSVPPVSALVSGAIKKGVSPKSILRISNTAPSPDAISHDVDAATGAASLSRKTSEILSEPAVGVVEPVHRLPEETIEGQFGLVKHRLLNDRRRVLTLDTAGDVLLWDLIKCQPIQSFGKKHLEDVEPQVNKMEAVAPWCSIDTSSGNLTVVLEPYNCFDAEAYADELVLDEPVEFKDDQRINLGKWILHYLFSSLIDEEIKRDEAHRQKLNETVEKRLAASQTVPSLSTTLPPPVLGSGEAADSTSPVTTPRANGPSNISATPGITVGFATPAPIPEGHVASPPSQRSPQAGRLSAEKEDYFSNAIQSADLGSAASRPGPASTEGSAEEKLAKTTTNSNENGKDKDNKDKDSKDKEKEKDNSKSPGTPFGKKFRMGMSFGGKKLGRSASSTAAEKPVVVDEKAEESESSSNHEKEVDDSFLGAIQKIRNEYEKQLSENPDSLVETGVVPSLPNETPVLKLPAGTKVIIQEETSGGSAEVYRGTVATVGADAEVIEQRGPMWLGEVLLTNTIPQKDPVKVSFILHPYQDLLPPIVSPDGNNRLNANRMLRVKKILAYVAERIDPPADPDNPDPDALKPEEYLELYCNDQLLPNTMSLATLRAHIWKGGNDIILKYKANGRKEIPLPPSKPPTSDEASTEQPEQSQPTLQQGQAAAIAA